MSWQIIYLIIGIVTLFFGVWNLAQRRNFLLSLCGILWFLIVLFLYFIPNVYRFVIITGLPAFGNILLYIVLPVLLTLGLLQGRSRS